MEPLDFIPSFFIPTYLTQAGYHEYKDVQASFFNREYITNANDNGLISIDWLINPLYLVNPDLKEKLLIIIHGLTGGSESVYIRDIADGFKHSYTVVIIHARGINDTPLNTPHIYTAGSTDDVKFAISYIRKNHNFKYAFIIGMSMGANLSYKLLANDSSFNDFFIGYISVSNFFNQLGAVIFNTGTITDYFLLKLRKSYISKHRDMIAANPNFDINDLENVEYLRHFDNIISTKMYNYKSVEEYYRKTECGPDIGKIQVKTLILVAKDDPIVMLFDEDYQKIKESDNIILVRTDYGGHIGWYEGLSPSRWFVSKCLSFCDSMYKLKSNYTIEDLVEYTNKENYEKTRKQSDIFKILKEDYYTSLPQKRLQVMNFFE